MNLSFDFNLPDISAIQFRTKLYDILRNITVLVNGMSQGYIAAYLSDSAAPTTGSHKQGDIVRNNNPTEQGAVTAKYVITGWICTVSGTPGTWLQMRTLTGN